MDWSMERCDVWRNLAWSEMIGDDLQEVSTWSWIAICVPTGTEESWYHGRPDRWRIIDRVVGNRKSRIADERRNHELRTAHGMCLLQKRKMPRWRDRKLEVLSIP